MSYYGGNPYQQPPHSQTGGRPTGHPPPGSGGSGAPPGYAGSAVGGYAGSAVGSQISAAPSSAPSGADPRLWYWFNAIDTDRNGKLTVDELQRALVNGNWRPFNIETVRLMMNMFDRDHSGFITFQEFSGLWKYIEDWKRCFQSFDLDGSGTIDRNELRRALLSFGYNLSEALVARIIKKYDRTSDGSVTFDNFIQVCVTVRTLTESFRRFDTDTDGWITIGYEQFIDLVVTNR